MAGTQTQRQPDVLPDPDTAYQNLFEGVGQRVFFHKLAALRPEYLPQNQQQAEALLKMAGDLRLAEEEDAVKQAADASDPFVAASLALSGQLQGFPGVQYQQAQEEQVGIKQAAAAFAEDPTIYNSVLSLKAFEAERLRAQLTRQSAAG